jgi:hypothetical protein
MGFRPNMMRANCRKGIGPSRELLEKHELTALPLRPRSYPVEN